MRKWSITRGKASRRGVGARSTDPRDDFWAGVIRHRDRLRTFRRPVKAAETTAAEKPAKDHRMTA